MSGFSAIVMAAGHGTRMKSSTPKVLHQAAGRALVEYPVRAALELGATEVIVVVNPATQLAIGGALSAAFPEGRVRTAVQAVPRGTGDAARAGMAAVTTDRVLILSGDTPLLRASDLKRLVDALTERELSLSFMTCLVDDPAGYGRVLRDSTAVGDAAGRVVEIREHKDLIDDQQRAVREINAGVYAARSDLLRQALSSLDSNNAQGELYLTDVVAILARGHRVEAVLGDPESLSGVNDRAQLRAAEEILFERVRLELAASGVTVRGRPLIDTTVLVEQDAIIEDGVRLRGATHIGSGAFIDVGCVITDTAVGVGTVVKPYSVLSDSRVGAAAQIGPFSHLRPDSQIDDEAHIGNFVETKKTRIRRGAKANHLAYLGDGDVGEGANLGAGTIFCNYDGFQKHRTLIGAGAFVGSDSQLIAPVRVGAGAYVGTGTSVTDDVPDDGFAIGRARQTTKEHYAAGLRERLQRSAAEAKAEALAAAEAEAEGREHDVDPLTLVGSQRE